MLEKSRVSAAPVGERNFHVFYTYFTGFELFHENPEKLKKRSHPVWAKEHPDYYTKYHIDKVDI